MDYEESIELCQIEYKPPSKMSTSVSMDLIFIWCVNIHRSLSELCVDGPKSFKFFFEEFELQQNIFI